VSGARDGCWELGAGKPASGDEKALPMPSLQQSGLLSLLEIQFQQNVTVDDRSRKKDVILYRSKPECA
jgi:hypothetical protein